MIDTNTPQPASSNVDKGILFSLYRSMLRIRVAEEKIAGLLEQKEIRCPTHLYTGQEAIAAGVCAVLNRQDYVFGAHRSHGHYLAKGGDLRAMMAELFGKGSGCARGRGGSMHLVAPEVGLMGTVPLVAATIPIAVGAALASKLRADRRVSVSFFGDGATEEGQFFESLNFASLNKLPVFFVCENNFYSSHMHISERRVEQNIYKFGSVHGMPGILVDGNDVIAVYQASVAAVERARRGEGPTLLECRTYRWRGHVGPSMDLDVGVQRTDELRQWLGKDPIARTKVHLEQNGMAASEVEKIEKETVAEIETAIEHARRSPFPERIELMDHVFTSERSA